MYSGYALANARRCWYVPDFNVWGTPGWGDLELVVVENIASVNSILFNAVNIGDGSQQVNYNNLTDFRGNKLPQSIKNPKIQIKPKSENSAFIIGTETDSSFKIARSSDIRGAVKVDLMILEMGE